jgi:hypothetical protein
MTPYGVKKGGYALLFYTLLLPVPAKAFAGHWSVVYLLIYAP